MKLELMTSTNEGWIALCWPKVVRTCASHPGFRLKRNAVYLEVSADQCMGLLLWTRGDEASHRDRHGAQSGTKPSNIK